MREQFYLALPMKPLCGDDCKGLCPTCGDESEPRHLRLCERAGRIPRLAALKAFERH